MTLTDNSIIDPSYRYKYLIRRRLLSFAVVVAVNLLPILGLLWSKWDLYELMALYWAENVIIGFFTLIKMLGVEADSVEEDKEVLQAVPGFFVYFILCFFQAALIQPLFSSVAPPLTEGETWLEGWHRMAKFFAFAFIQLRWVVAAMVFSHGFAYVYDYHLGGEKYRTSLLKLWALPAVRIIALMAIIIVAGHQLQEKVSPAKLFVIIIIAKIILEALFDGIRWMVTPDPYDRAKKRQAKLRAKLDSVRE